jgi:hypothetical protein
MAIIDDLYDQIGGTVTGQVQDYLDQIYQGAKDGSLAEGDVIAALNIVKAQAAQGMTGAGGAAPGVVAPTATGGSGGGNTGAVVDANEFDPAEGATAILRSGLAKYGLESLYDAVWSKYTKGEIPLDDADSFVYAIKNEDAYKKRFAGNEARKAKNLPELSPSTYLNLEEEYKQILSSNSLPAGFYDERADFEKLIGNDVSVFELNNRLKDAYRLVKDAPTDVTEKLRTMYGLSDGDIAAYFIDPDRIRPSLVASDYKRQAQAAMVAANAQRLGGLNVSVGFAEGAAAQGKTQAEQEKAFTTIADMNELRRTQGIERGLTADQLAGAALGTDMEARKILEDRKKSRIAGFSGDTNFTQTQSGGAIKSGIGRA